MNKQAVDLAEKVHRLFREKGLTLSVAESCTGGLISHYLTALPGASTFFLGGVVAYSEEVKNDLLGVSPDAIFHSGLVSRETALEMAEKVRLLLKTDCSLSATGNLGPDVLEGKEQGLVYIAANKHDATMSKELRLKGDREANKEETSLSALRLLIELVEQKDE